MQTSQRGHEFIAAHEGVVLKAYRDVVGVLTIGVGHTARAGGLVPKPGMRISRDEAMALLARDLKRFDARVTKTGAFASQTAHDGAASFDFNTGRIHNASWVKRYRNDDFRGSEASLMQWVKAGGKTWPGLVSRRESEADLIFRGRYGTAHPTKSRSTKKPEVEEYQAQLKSLGFYHGTVDGVSGKQTKAAILSFQRDHPHLDADGIVGPATRAALKRALNLRKRTAQAATTAAVSGGGVGTADKTAGADQIASIDFGAWGIGVGVVVLILLGAVIVWRYRDEIRHIFRYL